ncbi:Intestinal-type alkaline phosphatase, partial [Podiceps cristatus]
DRQVPASAGTGTAYLCGVKTNAKTLGLSGAAVYGKCRTAFGNEVDSILHRARLAGTGLRTTLSESLAWHSHPMLRSWYADTNMPKEALRDGCKDIAYQLVHNTDINVSWGVGVGGKGHQGRQEDPEYPNDPSQNGTRKDGLNLIAEWLSAKQGARYVWDKKGLDAVEDDSVSHLMGRSITDCAIGTSSSSPLQGCWCVPHAGGRIDHGHHSGRAKQALMEAVMLDRAVARAGELTSPSDTLTVVTADHSHVFTFGGNTLRGTSIFGVPAAPSLISPAPPAEDKDYRQQAAVPLETETHSGEDVVVLAQGPMAHLFHGVQEQSYIAHAMAYAACLEPY